MVLPWSASIEEDAGLYHHWWRHSQHILEILPHIRLARLVLIPPVPCPSDQVRQGMPFAQWAEEALRVEEHATSFVLHDLSRDALAKKEKKNKSLIDRDDGLGTNRLLARLNTAYWSIDVAHAPTFERSAFGVQVTFRLLSLTPNAEEKKRERLRRTQTASHALTAHELRPHLADIEQIACLSCAHPLVDYSKDGPLKAIKAMPSDHWQEVLECWVCHTEEHDLQKVPQQGIEAQADTLLVGETYWLVQNKIARSSIAASLSGSEESFVKCPQCQKEVGMTDASFPETSVRLNKHSTQIVMQSKGKKMRKSVSILTTVAQLILSAMEAHATRRFILQSPTAPHAGSLHLWVLNADVAFHASYIPFSPLIRNDEDENMRPIMKLLYAFEAAELSKEAQKEWATAETFAIFTEEDILSLKAYFDQLHRHFGALNQATNPSASSTYRMRVAWLPL